MPEGHLAAASDSTARDRLLDALRSGQGGRILRRLQRRERQARPSCSQRAILAAEALHPDSLVNTVGAMLELGTAHPLGDLVNRIRELAAEEVIFETAIVTDDDADILRSVPAAGPDIVTHDLSGLSAVEADAEVERHLGTLTSRRFDLARPPLVRFALFAMPGGRTRIAVVAHHVVADLASLQLVLRRLTEDKRSADMAGQDPPVDAGPTPAAIAAALAHFHARLANVPRDMPLIAPMLADRTGSLACRPLVAGHTLRSADLRRLAHSLGATPFEVLLAAFAASLASLGGASALVLGLPVSRRAADADVLGCHVGLMPFAVRFGEGQTFRHLVGVVAADLRGDLPHAAVPLERLLSELGAERPGGRHPLFQATFTAFEAPTVADAAVVLMPRRETVFDVCCDIAIGEETLHAAADIRPGRIRPAAAQVALDGCVGIIEAALADPDMIPAEFVVARRAACLDEDADRFSGTPPSLDDILDAVAGHNPSRIAIEMSPRTTTYGELNALSAAISNALVRRGLGQGDLIAVLLDRTPALPAALLGVLGAGAAYLPLDASLPAERLRILLARAAPAALLASPATLRALGDGALPAHVLDLADIPRSAAETKCRTDDAARAYSIFTSGSSGAPKAVDIPRRALASIVDSVAAECSVGEGILLSATTVAFDIAALELLLPLYRGGTLRLAGEHEARDPWALAALLNDRATRAFQTTPSRLRTILDTGAFAGHDALTLLVGGEPLPQALAERLRPRCGMLLNMYGPTETTIWSTYGDPSGLGGVCVGHPARHTRIRVLGPGNRPVAPGLPGEIAIGGRGLALGYAADPALTATRFVPDPERPGERLFLTGDLGARDEDGCLYVSGRRDEQLKIRGHRIEPAEVEAELETLAEGIRAAVFAVETDGATRLHAAIAGAFDEAGLAARLRTRLTGAMMPSRIHSVAVLPETAAGKIDRRALRAMVEASAALSECSTGTGGAEGDAAAVEVIAAMFVGHGARTPQPEDDFFALGGDSIGLVRLIADIGRSLAVRLPIGLVQAGPVTPMRLSALVAAEIAGTLEAEADMLLDRVEALSDEAAAAALAAHSLVPGEAAWTPQR